MAETKVNNRSVWYIFWALVILGAVFAATQALKPREMEITWRRVLMDGHRSGVKPFTADNLDEALGRFTEEGYISPAGTVYENGSPMADVAATLKGVQPHMAQLKQVIGHSARMMMNYRDNPDLPLGNLFADVLRSYATQYFKQPVDVSITNFGGIRIPMPKGDVTLDDISSMFPFKNYLCLVKIKGSELTKLYEQLAGTKAFQATSGATIRVKAHELESALVGGKPIDPDKVYRLATIDFLLDGGDQLRIGALAQDVTLTHVLLKDIMLWYVKDCEAKGKLIDATADGRVIMED